MKKLLTILIFATATIVSVSQNNFPSTGNAGVGTATPSVPF